MGKKIASSIHAHTFPVAPDGSVGRLGHHLTLSPQGAEPLGRVTASVGSSHRSSLPARPGPEEDEGRIPRGSTPRQFPTPRRSWSRLGP